MNKPSASLERLSKMDIKTRFQMEIWFSLEMSVFLKLILDQQYCPLVHRTGYSEWLTQLWNFVLQKKPFHFGHDS